MVSRNELWKTEGVSTFSLGVLVLGHGIHSCVYIHMFGWSYRATYCSVVSTLMLGVPHAIQNEKKLKKFTQSDSVYLVSTLMLGVSHAVEVLVLGLLVVV